MYLGTLTGSQFNEIAYRSHLLLCVSKVQGTTYLAFIWDGILGPITGALGKP